MLTAMLVWTSLAYRRDDSPGARDAVSVLPGDGVDVLRFMPRHRLGRVLPRVHPNVEDLVLAIQFGTSGVRA